MVLPEILKQVGLQQTGCAFLFGDRNKPCHGRTNICLKNIRRDGSSRFHKDHRWGRSCFLLGMAYVGRELYEVN